MSNNKRIKIIRGGDETFVLKMRTRTDKDPMDLTEVSKIRVILVRSNRQKLILTSEMTPSVPAKGKLQGVTFTASSAGDAGNEIMLTFNGDDNVDTIVAAWNEANPGNPVTHNGLGDETIPEQSLTLEGGYNSYQPVIVFGNPVLGKIKVRIIDANTNLLRIGLNQSLTVEVDYGPHPTGERVVAEMANFIDVFDPNY